MGHGEVSAAHVPRWLAPHGDDSFGRIRASPTFYCRFRLASRPRPFPSRSCRSGGPGYWSFWAGLSGFGGTSVCARTSACQGHMDFIAHNAEQLRSVVSIVQTHQWVFRETKRRVTESLDSPCVSSLLPVWQEERGTSAPFDLTNDSACADHMGALGYFGRLRLPRGPLLSSQVFILSVPPLMHSKPK